jgi:hypothetical protein
VPRIFMSYRRNDSSGYAGRIADRLHAAFGADNVFMDVDDIKPGFDFTEELHRALAGCDALIALIGPNWLKASNTSGARRIDDPQDFVRQEISAALERKIRVIPVLLQKADMPASADLPEALAPLALHQGIELSDSRWDYDVDQLIKALGGRSPVRSGVNRAWILATGGLALAAIALAATVYFRPVPSIVAKSDHQARKQAAQRQTAQKQEAAGAPTPSQPAQSRSDLSGKWIGEWTAANGRQIKIQFLFEVSGDTLMGSVRYPTGEGGIQEGRIDGDRVLFLTRHTPQFEDKEVTISFVGRISADGIDFIMQRPEGANRLVAHRQSAS